MSSTIKYQINKTEAEEYSLLCIKCSGKTAHKVISSLGVYGDEEHMGAFICGWTTENQIVQCLGCKSISFRIASTNSEDYDPEDGTPWIQEILFPSRVEGIKGLGSQTRYLPLNIRRIYDETLIALSSNAPVLAGIGLRALLETVCKEKQAHGKNLQEKIDSLSKAGALTPNSAAILHRIRTLGNAAAHEVKPHNNKQLSLAMDIVEHLLKDVYILPKQVESAFGD
jgi:Domain of unknown function (DUF4145)